MSAAQTPDPKLPPVRETGTQTALQLLPIGAGIALQDAGLLSIELPTWLLVTSYALGLWSTGPGFNRAILRHAAEALPRILILMRVCVYWPRRAPCRGCRHGSLNGLSRHQSGLSRAYAGP